MSAHTHPRATRRLVRRTVPLLAAGLVAAALPWTTGSAAAAAEDDPAFSGFSGLTTATPVHIELYEPTIPLPAVPQVELWLGYSKVEFDSSSSLGRASWLWPGDTVGEGAKTIVENLGLPEPIAAPLAAQGYPLQVNSSYPSGESSQSQEPFPGMVMRTSAGEKETVAQTGWSVDGQVQDRSEDKGGKDEEGGAPSLPELPGLPIPGLSSLSGLPGIGSLLGAAEGQQAPRTGRTQKAAAEEAPEEPASPGLPPELAAVVDVGGYIATSRSENLGDEVRTTSRTALGDISLLEGLVQLSGLSVKAVSSSDGTKGVPTGRAVYGTLTIAGTEFAVGPDGLEAAGQSPEIPTLPNDPNDALKQLGLSITFPGAKTEREQDKATSLVEAMVVELDTSALQAYLKNVPLAALVDLVPNEAGPLKSVLGAVVNLAPRIVVHLGKASATVDTVQGIEIPTGEIPSNNTSGGDSDSGVSDGGPTASGGAAGVPGSGSAPAAPGDAGAGAGAAAGGGDATGTLDAAPAAGLPPLFSIPGALLFGAIVAAGVAGSYFRKIGAAALGAGTACPHGLDSGLPDLRKA